MQRRDFLKWQLKAAGCIAGAHLLYPVASFAEELTRPDIVIAKGDPTTLARTTRAAVDALGGMGRFVKPGFKVVIKPNMSFAQAPEWGTNTHPDVVAEVVRMCKESGAATVRVLDHSLQNAGQALARSGILDACNAIEANICHHLMEVGFYRETAVPNALSMRSNLFMTDVLEADALIAVPAAKSHGGAGVSLSLKGQMGLVWDRSSMHSRFALDTAIVDMNTLIKPHLVIIDASRVLSTGGPGGPGLVLKPSEIIASADPVAADSAAVAEYEWYGQKLQGRHVRYIREAHERGLGRMDIENLVTTRITV